MAGPGNGNGDGNALATRHGAESSRETLAEASEPQKLGQSGPTKFPPLSPKAATPGGEKVKPPPSPPPLPLKTGFEVGAAAEAAGQIPPTVKTSRDAVAKISGSREMPVYRPGSRPPFEANPQPPVRVEPPPSTPDTSIPHTTHWLWVTFGIVLVVLVLLLNFFLIFTYFKR